MRKIPTFTHAYLLSRLHYDPATGIFTWLSHRSKQWVGRRAGKEQLGYRTIHLGEFHCFEAPLAWFYMTGAWPKEQVDHKNLIKNDNRWENLREATSSQNAGNIRSKRATSSKYKGVTKVKGTSPWKATLEVGGQVMNLGYFYVETEAARAYDRAAKKHFGEYARLNFSLTERDWLYVSSDPALCGPF